MRSLIKIILILFLTVTSQANEDIKKVEDDIKKDANHIADTLKIEIAIKGKKLTNFFTNNNLVLISEKGTREYKFKDKSYEIIQNNNVIQSGTWKINGLLKNQIRLISNDDKKKYYLKKISRKPWIYNYDKPPGSEGAEKEILHIKSSSKFNEISSDITFAEKEISDTSSKSDKKDKKKKVKKEKKIDKKKNNSKNKDQEWFSEHNEVNSWHEPINLYSKYWHYYRSQPDIDYGIENLGYVWLAKAQQNYPKTSSEVVDLYIGQRIIDPIEGIWKKGNYKIAIFKQDDDYLIFTIDTEYPNYDREKLRGSGILVGTLIKKDQESNYFGYEQMFTVPSEYDHYAYFCGGPVSYFLNNSNKVTVTHDKKYTGCKKNEKLSLKRVWPKDLEAYNSKFKKSDTSIANNRLEEKLNLNIIMQKDLYPQWRYSIFTQNLDKKLVVKPEIEELTFNDCFFSNQYLKEYKQLLYLSNDGVNRTIEEIYENNGVINIKENLFNYLKQYLKEEYNFKGKLKRQCAQETWASKKFRSLSGDYEHQYQILILPKGLKIDKIYILNSIGQIANYPLKQHFEHNRFLGVVAEIDINKFNNAYASVNSKAQKSRNDKKNESQLIRSLASKDDRNHVLMYTLKAPSYWKQTYCFINNSNSNKWDPALTAYIHHGYDNFHEDDFTKYINIVANDVKIKDKYNPNIIYNESDDTFDFEYRWNSGDKGIIATKDVINELFLGIKSEKYNCTIIVGYPQDLTKIIDALKRDNFFKLEYLPLQGKLRKVSDLNKKYDQVVKIWKEYYEDERKRQAMKNQAYQEKYGELINKYPNCATTYYYIKGRMAQFSRNSWQYNKLDALKRNIEGLVSATGSADDPNSRAHCQKFLVMSYNTN